MTTKVTEAAEETSAAASTSKSEPRKEPSLLPSLLGTWTLQTHASADLGYYKASAFVVIHVMADPLAAYSCSIVEGCDELQNQMCQRTVDACVDMASSVSQWSDVSIFYQFGFDVLSGTYPWRTHVVQNTSGWLGPYSVILPQHNFHIQSRYVTTVATDYLQPPINFSLVPTPSLFDQYAGATAVHNSIAQQTKLLHITDDPYAAQLESCANGDIHPILPRIGLQKQKDDDLHLEVNMLLLSLPMKGDDKDLYNVWPGVQKHLPEFPVAGPYCFQDDPHRAYAVNVSWATASSSSSKENISPWKMTPGCVADLPCWPTEHPPKPDGGGGSNNDGGGDASMIWNLLTTYGVYFLLVGFIVSLTFNCELSYQLQRRREQHSSSSDDANETNDRRHGQRRRRHPRRAVDSASAAPASLPNPEQQELQEPLLHSSVTMEANEKLFSTAAAAAADALSGTTKTQVDIAHGGGDRVTPVFSPEQKDLCTSKKRSTVEDQQELQV